MEEGAAQEAQDALPDFQPEQGAETVMKEAEEDSTQEGDEERLVHVVVRVCSGATILETELPASATIADVALRLREDDLCAAGWGKPEKQDEETLTASCVSSLSSLPLPSLWSSSSSSSCRLQAQFCLGHSMLRKTVMLWDLLLDLQGQELHNDSEQTGFRLPLPPLELTCLLRQATYAVECWGAPSEWSSAGGVLELIALTRGFAANLEDGRVALWGCPAYGSDLAVIEEALQGPKKGA